MKKVGVIDSGIGGLSLLAHLMKMQDECEFFYQSDHSNVPYGGKDQEFMLKQTVKMVDKLIKQNIDLVVIACNTLTAETIDILRSLYSIPFVGIEPFVNFINTDLCDESHKVGLILTPATAKSLRFKTLKGKLDPQNKIEVVPLPNLALIIEEMGVSGIKGKIEDLEKELEPLKNYGFDILLCGCTHYPLVGGDIERLLGLKVLDPHVAVCKRALKLLEVDGRDVGEYRSVKFKYASEIDSEFSEQSLSNFEFF